MQLDVVHPWSQKAVVKSTFRPTLGRSLLLKIAGIICIIGVLAIGGWYASRNASELNEIHTEKDPSIKHKATVYPQVSVVVQEKDLQPTETIAQSPDAKGAPEKRIPPDVLRAGPRTTPYRFPEKAAESQPSIDRQMPHEDVTDAKDTTVAKTVSSPSRTLSLVGERKDDTRLKLQAIAWSPDPEKRIAVINDRVVKEGNSIDGISVRQIDEDQVVVQEGGVIWKIVFDLK